MANRNGCYTRVTAVKCAVFMMKESAKNPLQVGLISLAAPKIWSIGSDVRHPLKDGLESQMNPEHCRRGDRQHVSFIDSAQEEAWIRS